MNAMPPLSKLNLYIKRILDQSPRSDWTSNGVWERINFNIVEANKYSPEKAPKVPSLARVRTVLSTLTEMQHIKLTVHQEGSHRYHTYERIIPEPLIKIEWRDPPFPWGLIGCGAVMFALFGFVSGVMT